MSKKLRTPTLTLDKTPTPVRTIARQIASGRTSLLVLSKTWAAVPEHGESLEIVADKLGIGKSTAYAARHSAPSTDVAQCLLLEYYSTRLKDIAAQILDRTAPLAVAVAAWCAGNSVRETDLGPLTGYTLGAWARSKLRTSSGLDNAIRELIKYPERQQRRTSND